MAVRTTARDELRREQGPSRRPVPRWDLVLPAAALVVAVALVVLGFATTAARSERRTLALEGRLARLAREVELQLRESPGEAGTVLEQTLAGSNGLVRGLVLDDAAGAIDGRAGVETGPGALEVDLFLGSTWHRMDGMGAEGMEEIERGRGSARRQGRGPGMRRGRRVLRLVPAQAALSPPWTERLLLPTVLLAASALVGLAIVVGRLLVRRQQEVLLEAERQRLEGLARAGAGLAHQLRTPLATVKGSSQLLLEEVDTAASGPRGETLRRVVEQAERMEHLLGNLLDYARPTRAERRTVGVAALAAELGELDPRVRSVVPDHLTVEVDPDHLRQILVNLVENALAVGPEGTPVEVVARGLSGGSGESGAASSIEITVADRGPGPGGDPERLFEPYVTSRADGTGLGLPIARSLARANGGDVSLVPRAGGGAVAIVRLPGGKEAP